MQGTLCSVPDCGREAKAKHLCLMHYKRARYKGTLLPPQRDAKKQPHYQLWARLLKKGLLCPEWQDVRVFSAGIPEKPYRYAKLLQVDTSKPYGPGNVEWTLLQPKGAAYHKERRLTDPSYSRASELKKKFGMGLGDYGEMFRAQNGVCAICEKEEWVAHKKTGRVFSLGVDHDHATGAVRGLLCVNCNKILGHAHDDIDKLRAAIRYLEIHQSESKVVLFTARKRA